MKKYAKLDLSKIKFSHQPLSTKDSLLGIDPIEWDSDILSGKRKVIITSPLK